MHAIVNTEIFVGDYFAWASVPTKIKPTKICTHVELATVTTSGYAYPQKLVPTKI